MSRVFFALVLVLISCTKPAGPRVEHVKREIDLRSTLLIIFPEYRGAQVVSGAAKLTRVVAGAPQSNEALALKTLELNRFMKRGEVWVRDPFEVSIEGSTWSIAVPLDQGSVERLYMAPTAMGTADLGMWFPRDKSIAIEREVFDVTLTYETAPFIRAEFLTRQLVRLLLANSQWRATALPDGWDVDGGQPLPFEARLEEVTSHASLTVHREGNVVSLHYILVTDEVR